MKYHTCASTQTSPELIQSQYLTRATWVHRNRCCGIDDSHGHGFLRATPPHCRCRLEIEAIPDQLLRTPSTYLSPTNTKILPQILRHTAMSSSTSTDPATCDPAPPKATYTTPEACFTSIQGTCSSQWVHLSKSGQQTE